jgi:hypothetical protein
MGFYNPRRIKFTNDWACYIPRSKKDTNFGLIRFFDVHYKTQITVFFGAHGNRAYYRD